MTLKLYIGNKNYSSWSMRAGVLLRAFGIAHDEYRPGPFPRRSTYLARSRRCAPRWRPDRDRMG